MAKHVKQKGNTTVPLKNKFAESIFKKSRLPYNSKTLNAIPKYNNNPLQKKLLEKARHY